MRVSAICILHPVSRRLPGFSTTVKAVYGRCVVLPHQPVVERLKQVDGAFESPSPKANTKPTSLHFSSQKGKQSLGYTY